MREKPFFSAPVLALLAASTLWASSFIALKVAFRHYDPMVVIFGRMFVATLCFAAFRKNFRSVNYQPGDWKWLLFMAFCEPCCYFVFEAMALQNTQASQAGMIVAMLPLMIAVGARFWLGEIITRRTISGFLLAVVGAVLLSLGAQETDASPHPVLGNVLELMAMVCATGYMLTLKRLCVRYSPWFLTAVQAATGSVFFLPSLFLPGTELPAHFSLEGALMILYLGAGITIGAYGLYNYGVSKIPAHQASAFTNLIPVITLALGWAILGERLTLLQYLASGVVLLGVILSQDRRAHREQGALAGGE
jgi:drug/metabolite transporter (DMT)-like permease